GILTFNEDEIRINSKLGPISIKGEGFEILYIATSTITISGKFASISYEE
ncbi:sporulation protein YqfC, partial [Clostridium saudiense]|nr:sporulation protein YqfC [Clostridium saudiense]